MSQYLIPFAVSVACLILASARVAIKLSPYLPARTTSLSKVVVAFRTGMYFASAAFSYYGILTS